MASKLRSQIAHVVARKINEIGPLTGVFVAGIECLETADEILALFKKEGWKLIWVGDLHG